jgi:hypothetical protein
LARDWGGLDAETSFAGAPEAFAIGAGALAGASEAFGWPAEAFAAVPSVGLGAT